jgi:hypothetical protein
MRSKVLEYFLVTTGPKVPRLQKLKVTTYGTGRTQIDRSSRRERGERDFSHHHLRSERPERLS